MRASRGRGCWSPAPRERSARPWLPRSPSRARASSCSISTRTRARTLADSLPGDGHVGLGTDLADVARHDELVERAEDAVGPLTALAHLAAVLYRRHDIREVDELDWDTQVDVNLKATFFLNRAFAERLRDAGRPGAIVNFSSQGWWTGGFGGSVVYNATKGGIVTMTRGLARTYAPAAIRVNAVAPGLVESAMVRDDLPPSTLQGLVDQIPLGRVATPEEIAARGRLPRVRARDIHHRRDAEHQRWLAHVLRSSMLDLSDQLLTSHGGSS